MLKNELEPEYPDVVHFVGVNEIGFELGIPEAAAKARASARDDDVQICEVHGFDPVV